MPAKLLGFTGCCCAGRGHAPLGLIKAVPHEVLKECVPSSPQILFSHGYRPNKHRRSPLSAKEKSSMTLESPLMSLDSLLVRPLSWWDGRFAFAAAAVLLPLLLTYTLTALRADWVKNVRGKGDPPPVPYAVPILGNTLQFAYDTEGFLARTL
jgi:hypothetical protein